ncbi:hypothetical protein C9374_011218 [Naegleria lovaniensis]|uniref:Uncharacterized protein n=1 Tax=Naegleria lovaniensis TaxID=51637 RepID=A0AA88GWV1_NAELO|nr:uncharacterized protein C9374_011218 [Naegleria lovaniensis]KAG2392493.1 hypothetical protein C9374_011218 [Naegleria lovaniensis]
MFTTHPPCDYSLDNLPEEILAHVCSFLLGTVILPDNHHDEENAISMLNTTDQDRYFAVDTLEYIGFSHYNNVKTKNSFLNLNELELAHRLIPICGVNKKLRDKIRQNMFLQYHIRAYTANMLKFVMCGNDQQKSSFGLPVLEVPYDYGYFSSVLDVESSQIFSNTSTFVKPKKRSNMYCYSLELEVAKSFIHFMKCVFGEDNCRVMVKKLVLPCIHAKIFFEMLALFIDEFPCVEHLIIVEKIRFSDCLRFQSEIKKEFDLSLAKISLPKLKNLKSLVIEGSKISQSIRDILLDWGKDTIEHFTVDSELTVQQVRHIFSSCSQLKTFGCFGMDIHASDFSKKKCRDYINYFEDHFTKIRKYYCDVFHSGSFFHDFFSKNAMFNLANTIEELFISAQHSNIILSEDFHFPNLRSLVVKYGSLTLDGVEMPNLRRLISFSTVSVTEKQKPLTKLEHVCFQDFPLKQLCMNPHLQCCHFFQYAKITLSDNSSIHSIRTHHCTDISINNLSNLKNLNLCGNAQKLVIKNQERIENINLGPHGQTVTLLNIELKECDTFEIGYLDLLIERFYISKIGTLHFQFSTKLFSLLSQTNFKGSTVKILKIYSIDAVIMQESVRSNFMRFLSLLVITESVELEVNNISNFSSYHGKAVFPASDHLEIDITEFLNKQQFWTPIEDTPQIFDCYSDQVSSLCFLLDSDAYNIAHCQHLTSLEIERRHYATGFSDHCFIKWSSMPLLTRLVLNRITLMNHSSFYHDRLQGDIITLGAVQDIDTSNCFVDELNLDTFPLLEYLEISNCEKCKVVATKHLSNLVFMKITTVGNLFLHLPSTLSAPKLKTLLVTNIENWEDESCVELTRCNSKNMIVHQVHKC